MAKNSKRDRQITEIRLKDLLAEYENRKCSVYLLHGDLAEEEMNSVYQHEKVKALINIGHGEGFGLPLFEAAYNGLPIVTIGWGGQCDYLYMDVKDKKGKTKKTSMFSPVSYDLKIIQPEARWDGVIQADSQWAFAKEWDYKKVLRSVRKNYGESKSKAKKLQKYVTKEFSSSVMYNKFVEACMPAVQSQEAIIEEVLSSAAHSHLLG